MNVSDEPVRREEVSLDLEAVAVGRIKPEDLPGLAGPSA